MIFHCIAIQKDVTVMEAKMADRGANESIVCYGNNVKDRKTKGALAKPAAMSFSLLWLMSDVLKSSRRRAVSRSVIG